MDPRDADWWWRYGLDGVVGGVLGGLVGAAVGGLLAMYVLRKTLAHERELVATSAKEQREVEDTRSARETAIRLGNALIRFEAVIDSPTTSLTGWRALADELITTGNELVIRLLGAEPAVARELSGSLKAISDLAESPTQAAEPWQLMREHLQGLDKVVNDWLVDGLTPPPPDPLGGSAPPSNR